MKRLTVLVLLSISSVFFAQEKNTFYYSDQSFEKVPIFPGCNETLSNYGLKFCMSQKFSEIISKNFNTSLLKNIDSLEEHIEIIVTFTINKYGKVVNINAETPFDKLKQEAIRVVKLFPILTPGWQRGKFVSVPYSLPIKLEVDKTV